MKDSPGAQHSVIIANFRDAVNKKADLIAPAEEGINALELGNGMLFSGLENRTIELPVDAEAYYSKLQDLISNSKFQKR